jgi:hypothetical protein
VLKGAKASASNVCQNLPQYGPDKAIDDDESTRWATDYGTYQAELEVTLDKPAEVGEVFIKEACGSRVRHFVVEYEKHGRWRPLCGGQKIGDGFRATSEPVTAKRFRLRIRKATEGPTIWEFQLCP